MRTCELDVNTGIRPLRYPLRDVPHATLEINRTCNIRCRCCYNLSKTHVKSLDAVKREIDLLLTKRNLGVLTILGGEPTLHPDLMEIVSYVKSRGLVCQLLTNGLVFLEDASDRLLDGLVLAGVDRFIVHIDSGQAHVHGDIEKARQALFSKLEKKRAAFALSITVYNEDRGLLPELARRYSRFRRFDSILAILARDPVPPRTQDVELAGEYRRIRSAMGLEPTAYIPAAEDEEVTHWLLYSYFIQARTGSVFGLSPLLDRFGRELYRWIAGRYLFVVRLKPAWAAPFFLLAGLADSILHPQKALPFLKMWVSGGGGVRFQFIVIQAPPEFDEACGRLSFCHHCPDATIRNGKLTPVCLADQISPLDGPADGSRYKDMAWAVYAHLGEA